MGSNNDSYFLYYLYKKYYGYMWGYAYHLAENKDTADDLVQTVAVGMVKNSVTLKKITEPRQIKAYLKVAVSNTFKNYLKKKSKSPKTVNIDMVIEPSAISFENDVLEKIDNEKIINIIMDNLTEREKDILTLYSMGFPYKEISDNLFISKSNVSVIIHRLKKRLRSLSFGGEVHEK